MSKGKRPSRIAFQLRYRTVPKSLDTRTPGGTSLRVVTPFPTEFCHGKFADGAESIVEPPTNLNILNTFQLLFGLRWYIK